MALVGLHNPPIEIGGFKMIDGFGSFILVQKIIHFFSHVRPKTTLYHFKSNTPLSIYSIFKKFFTTLQHDRNPKL
jgi:hypothetical protein